MGTLLLLLTGAGLGFALLLYNVIAAALFLREQTGGRASGLARAAWGLGVAAVFLWWAPCVGFLLAVAAIVASAVERGRIFRDEAALAGVTPVRLGNLDGVMVLVLQFLLLLGFVIARVLS